MTTQRTDRTPAELIGGALELEYQAAHFARVLDGFAEWGTSSYISGARTQLEQVIAKLTDDAEHLRALAAIKAGA